MESRSVPITSYTGKDLASIYNISTKTVQRQVRLLEPIMGPRMGHYLTPRQVRFIVEALNKRFTPDARLAVKLLEKRRKRLAIANAPKRKRV